MKDENQPDNLIFPRRKMLKMLMGGLATTVVVPTLFSINTANAVAITGGKKVLTVFYSRTGGTRTVAQFIHQAVGGDILEIQPVTPYSSDYDTATEESRRELLTGERRALQPMTIDIDSYDVIFIGSPRWWGTLSVPMLTFITQYNLSQKTLIPFSTHGGGSRDKVEDDVKVLYPNSKILDALALSGRSAGTSQHTVMNWLRKIGMVQQN